MNEERIRKLAELASDITKELKKLEAELNGETVVDETEWKPKENELYYYVDLDCMTVESSYWEEDDEECNIKLNHKVIFKTREEAEEYLEYLKAKEKAMNEFSKEEWKNSNIVKNYIFYDILDNIFDISCNNHLYTFNTPYFRTEKDAREFINKYKKYIRKDMGI